SEPERSVSEESLNSSQNTLVGSRRTSCARVCSIFLLTTCTCSLVASHCERARLEVSRAEAALALSWRDSSAMSFDLCMFLLVFVSALSFARLRLEFTQASGRSHSQGTATSSQATATAQVRGA